MVQALWMPNTPTQSFLSSLWYTDHEIKDDEITDGHHFVQSMYIIYYLDLADTGLSLVLPLASVVMVHCITLYCLFLLIIIIIVILIIMIFCDTVIDANSSEISAYRILE